MSIVPFNLVDYVNWRNQFIVPKSSGSNKELSAQQKEVLYKQKSYFIECMNESKKIDSDKCKQLDRDIKYSRFHLMHHTRLVVRLRY